MPIAIPINLLTRLGSIRPLLKRNESEPLCSTRFAIFGEEDARYAAEAFEDVTQVVFFGEFGDLLWVGVLFSKGGLDEGVVRRGGKEMGKKRRKGW